MNNIRYLRRLKGLKQEDLNGLVSQSRLSRIENGAAIELDEAVQIAHFFGVPVSFIQDETLSLRYKTWEALEAGLGEERKRQESVRRHEEEVSVAPMRVKALTEHYITMAARLSGRSEAEVRQEIEVEFHRFLIQHQKSMS